MQALMRRLFDATPLMAVLTALGFGVWMIATAAFASGETLVTTSPELRIALAAARAGDVLVLAPGTYTPTDLKTDPGRTAEDGAITIRSQDSANPAAFAGLKVKGVVGVIFDGVTFDYIFAPGDNGPDKKGINWPFMISGSTNVTIRNSLFDGDLASEGAPEDKGFPTATGLVVRGTRGLVLENNVFTLWGRALAIDGSGSVEIRGNDIHSIRMDGIDLAAINGAVIEGNHIHDFKRSLASKDHADMIQFWTAGTKSPSKNITIRGNLFDSGIGAYTQSIFMRNELVDQKKAGAEMYYRDVLIEQNVIINAHLHGITLGETDGLTIRNNTLIHNTSSDGPENNPKVWIPRINVSGQSSNVTITGNISDQPLQPRGRADWVISDNLAIQDRNPGGPGYYDSVFMAARTGDPADISIYAYRPGGPADGTGVGADALRPDRIGALTAATQPTGPVRVGAPPVQPPEGVTVLTAFVQVIPDGRYLNRFRFDASQSFIPAEGGSASYHWEVEGDQAEGPVLERDFATPGTHQVTLVVQMSDGTRDEARATVSVPETGVLRFDGATGTLLANGPKGPATLTDLPLADADGAKVLLTGAAKPYQVPPALVGGFFGASDFSLKLRFRTDGTPKAAGEILRVHQVLVLAIAANGGAELQLFLNGAAKPQVLKTAPLRLQDGGWHDLEVQFDATAGKAALWVDGAQKAAGRATSAIGPMQSWGLSLGNPFGQKTMNGQIASLTLDSNEARFAR